MSKVKIEGNASGTGTFTITSPNSSTDRTITLPDVTGNLISADASGNVSITGDLEFNSGYGSAATAYGCRAWVNFNGTGTLSIRGSGNISSVTDAGVGNYLPQFATAMPDTNYAAVGTAGNNSSGILGVVNAANRGTTFCQVYPISGGVDASYVDIAIFR
jgi:ribosomal protein S11